jgi:uncharacterized Zn-binding protein involved in type VI secretion
MPVMTSLSLRNRGMPAQVANRSSRPSAMKKPAMPRSAAEVTSPVARTGAAQRAECRAVTPRTQSAVRMAARTVSTAREGPSCRRLKEGCSTEPLQDASEVCSINGWPVHPANVAVQGRSAACALVIGRPCRETRLSLVVAVT